jgi:hypothetical protein
MSPEVSFARVRLAHHESRCRLPVVAILDREDLLGWIDAGRTWPGLSKAAWIALIGKMDALSALPKRTMVNPFHPGKTVVVHSPPTQAVVIVGGETVGRMRWSFDGPNEILVHGDASRVVPVAREVAARLGGTFYAVPPAKEGR